MQLKPSHIQEAIREKKLKWVAEENEFTKLSESDLIRHLGIIHDKDDLQKIMSRPKPNIGKIVADFKGLDQKNVEAMLDVTQPLTAFPLKHPFPFPYCFLFGIVDWRNYWGQNYVTSVKDQGGCGSCVAFGTVGTLESMVLIEHNVGLDLSEAELLFCGGGSCGGWWPSSAVTYLTNKGVSQESCFPYHDYNMACNTCSKRDGEAIQITQNVTITDVAQRKNYLRFVGPVMCVFDVYQDFFAYKTGVYSHVTGANVGSHCVEVIGFNDCEGCWICKNSWGANWGDNGFFQIAYGQCGIDSSYPFWGIGGTKWFT